MSYYYNIDSIRLWSKQLSYVYSIKKYHDKNFVGLIKYINGSMSLVKIPNGVFIGSYFKTTIFPIKIFKNLTLGFKTLLGYLKKYSLIYDVSFKPYAISKIAKSSGNFCQIISFNKDLDLVLVKLPSQKKKLLSTKCFGVLGRNSNIFKRFEVTGGAGFNRNIGKKQIVRGVAMNPVDHPHGGRTKTNKPEVSPWGWVTKHSH